ncbi:VOC family protein [Ruicaihuangia caeni]|uniref:VOC family protein n=1 Tax=Ruicaihuangia caeni TaxID=3042517 RepID=A0AAW6T0P0_9MICO|nr:VOC family protein [Klugiella sp. YN-L-19]MDI2097386.1 VOC family protein [Klugiella sp. YN-L-19]
MSTLNHFGLTVKSIERSLEFYCDQIGFPRPDSISESSGEWIEKVTATADTLLRVAFVDTGDGAILELLEYARPDDGVATNDLRHHDVGSAHIAVNTDDIEGALERLSRAGARPVSDPQYIPSGGWEGTWIVYLRDPDGNTVELVQHPRQATTDE